MSQRIVVKVGTSTLTNTHGGIDRAFIADMTAQLATLRQQGNEVILVSSGAIRAGREVLENHRWTKQGSGFRNTQHRTADTQHPTPNTYGQPNTQNPEEDSLPFKQAAAAIGQGLLIHTYTEAFAWREVHCAQVLLTRDDLQDNRRIENAKNTLQTLLSLGVIPIINENDTVAVEEIKFGDNDNLAALVAILVKADLLLILSDVEGLYEKKPVENEEVPPIISCVSHPSSSLLKLPSSCFANITGLV